MSLWWASKNQLSVAQRELIENLPLGLDQLVFGSPGSGKTNILLRRAQFVRAQGMPRVLVLTFTRPLTEFIKTGCLDVDGAELFPRNSVSTYASWINELYDGHDLEIPSLANRDLVADRITLARGALGLAARAKFPRYDVLFVDEAQDLVPEEVELLREWGEVLFFVADKRQHIFADAKGMETIERIVPEERRHTLMFHYRLAPEICEVADKILVSQSGESLSSTQHYSGPTPGEVRIFGPASKASQVETAINELKLQMRAYGDFIAAGDRLGIIVARRDQREQILEALEADEALAGRSQILRARNFGEVGNYSPTLDPDRPILILTAAGCKGLEFRAVHWLFCDDGIYYFRAENYYTVVTRAKTRLDLYYEKSLPGTLAKACASPVKPW